MLKPFRYFKTNIIGGFRLSDINKQTKQDEVFYLDAHIVNISRSVKAALNAKWMIEITEKEAKEYLDIPRYNSKSDYIPSTSFMIENQEKQDRLMADESSRSVITQNTLENKEARLRADGRIAKIKGMKEISKQAFEVNDSVKDAMASNPQVGERLQNRLKTIQQQKFINQTNSSQNQVDEEERIAKVDAESITERIRFKRQQAQGERLKQAEEQRDKKFTKDGFGKKENVEAKVEKTPQAKAAKSFLANVVKESNDSFEAEMKSVEEYKNEILKIVNKKHKVIEDTKTYIIPVEENEVANTNVETINIESSKVIDEKVNDEIVEVKKGRGRPKKEKIEVEIVKEEVVKRAKGRPKKEKIEVEEVIVSEPKKGRGRPKKTIK